MPSAFTVRSICRWFGLYRTVVVAIAGKLRSTLINLPAASRVKVDASPWLAAFGPPFIDVRSNSALSLNVRGSDRLGFV